MVGKWIPGQARNDNVWWMIGRGAIVKCGEDGRGKNGFRVKPGMTRGWGVSSLLKNPPCGGSTGYEYRIGVFGTCPRKRGHATQYGQADLFEFLFDQELSVILEAAGQALPGGPDGGLSAGFGELAGDEGGLGGDEAVEGVGDGVDADGAVEAVPFDGAEVLVDGGAGGCSAHDTAGAGG